MMAPMRPKAKCPDLLETTDVPTLMTMRCAVKIFARAAALFGVRYPVPARRLASPPAPLLDF